jgi:hypothetical protein
MARILWLPGVLRAAGLDVVEEPGWKTRGRNDFDPRGLIAHCTAGGLAQSNSGALDVIIHGRPGLSGPIGQAMIERRTGRWRIVASGASNHAKTGWGGPLKGHGNRTLIGVECHHTNIADPKDRRYEPWHPDVYQSYTAGFAAICKHQGWDPLKRISGHKEHQPGEKSDPAGLDMGAFRSRVRQIIEGADDMAAEFLPPDQGGNIHAWTLALRVEEALKRVKTIETAVEEVKARPAGTLALTPEDKADLIAGFAAQAEAAVRRVLGGLDGATPAGG